MTMKKSAPRLLPFFLCMILLLTPVLSLADTGHVLPDPELASCFPTFADKGKVPLSFEENADNGELEIWFGRISCCDGILVRCGGEVMLIDGGNSANGAATLLFIEQTGVKHVNYLFNTHHHDDHLEMQVRMIKRGNITADVFLTPYERGYNVDKQKAAEKVMDENGVEYHTVHDGDSMMLGRENSAQIRFYRWGGSTNANYASMMCRITYGERSIFLLADTCGLAQQELSQTRPDIEWKSDIIKAGHHGYTRQHPGLMELLDPECVIITNSAGGASETVEQMKKKKIPYFLTNKGTIYLHTDGGDSWYIYQDKSYLDRK